MTKIHSSRLQKIAALLSVLLFVPIAGCESTMETNTSKDEVDSLTRKLADETAKLQLEVNEAQEELNTARQENRELKDQLANSQAIHDDLREKIHALNQRFRKVTGDAGEMIVELEKLSADLSGLIDQNSRSSPALQSDANSGDSTKEESNGESGRE